MKTYKFECYDEDENTTTTVEFSTESDCWIGSDGPVYKFHNFLKGCGFVFAVNDELGIMKESGNFVSCFEDSCYE